MTEDNIQVFIKKAKKISDKLISTFADELRMVSSANDDLKNGSSKFHGRGNKDVLMRSIKVSP